MSTHSSSAALPVARAVLRVLIVLNWLAAAAIAALLLVVPHRAWILDELALSPTAEAEWIIWGLRAVAVIGLASIPLNHTILARLLAIVETVRAGDPFVGANAGRLQTIAWALLALQILSGVVGFISEAISTPERPIDLDAGFSVAGWLAVLLTFLLSRVFAEGTLMREDLEGTV